MRPSAEAQGSADLDMDLDHDRDYEHDKFARSMKLVGPLYFNNTLGKLKVDFPETEDADYISPLEIDGAEVILL